MCVLVFHQEGKSLTPEQLNTHAVSNRDGFGFMYVDEDRLKVEKFMVQKQFVEAYLARIKQHGKTSPFVVHFRMGTSGKKNLENCHPFYMVDNEVAMAHNGIINFDVPEDKNEHSDTYVFNKYVMQGVGKNVLYNPTVEKLVTSFIGTSNKIVVMDKTKTFKILNSQLGEWDDGIWRSFKSKAVARSYDTAKCAKCGGKIYSSYCISIKDNWFHKEVKICTKCSGDMGLEELFRGYSQNVYDYSR